MKEEKGFANNVISKITESPQIKELELLLVESYIGRKLTDEEYEDYRKRQKERFEKENIEMKELNKIVGTEFKIGNRTFVFIGVEKDFNFDEVEYIVEEIIHDKEWYYENKNIENNSIKTIQAKEMS